jgi:hypothetical protein
LSSTDGGLDATFWAWIWADEPETSASKAKIDKATVFTQFLSSKMLSQKDPSGNGMLTGQTGFADVRKGMSPQRHQAMHLLWGRRGDPSTRDVFIVNEKC